VCFNYEIDSRTGHRFVNHTFDQVRRNVFFFLILFPYFDGKLIAGTLLSSYFVTELFCVCVVQLDYWYTRAAKFWQEPGLAVFVWHIAKTEKWK